MSRWDCAPQRALTWITCLIAATWAVGAALFAWLQWKGYCLDTYQAIWGLGLEHPGNRISPIGWGIRRVRPATPTLPKQGEIE
jgi:hypothetical protein